MSFQFQQGQQGNQQQGYQGQWQAPPNQQWQTPQPSLPPRGLSFGSTQSHRPALAEVPAWEMGDHNNNYAQGGWGSAVGVDSGLGKKEHKIDPSMQALIKKHRSPGPITMPASILPSVEDLTSENNPVWDLPLDSRTTVWPTVDAYIADQARLLRADFSASLRQAFQERHSDEGSSKIFWNVKFEGRHVAFNEGLVHVLSFDAPKTIDFRDDGALHFGNGLVLRNDNNNMTMFAYVVSGEPAHLKEGAVVVKFLVGGDYKNDSDVLRMFPTSFSGDTNAPIMSPVVMIEAPAFHFAYNTAYESLKTTLAQTHQPLPLHAIATVQPAYLRQPDYLDEKTMSPEAIEAGLNRFEERKRQEEGDPNFCLHFEQRAALRLILNNSLALIQGPPGTGKTFLAASVVDFINDVMFTRPLLARAFCNDLEKSIAAKRASLLRLQHDLRKWVEQKIEDDDIIIRKEFEDKLAEVEGARDALKDQYDEYVMRRVQSKLGHTLDAPPLIVTAYKNESLDQILNRCRQFEPDVMRLGSRTSDFNLYPHNLLVERRALMKLWKANERAVPERLRGHCGEAQAEADRVTELKREITKQLRAVVVVYKLTPSVLRAYASPEQLQSLNLRPNSDDKTFTAAINAWLPPDTTEAPTFADDSPEVSREEALNRCDFWEDSASGWGENDPLIRHMLRVKANESKLRAKGRVGESEQETVMRLSAKKGRSFLFNGSNRNIFIPEFPKKDQVQPKSIPQDLTAMGAAEKQDLCKYWNTRFFNDRLRGRVDTQVREYVHTTKKQREHNRILNRELMRHTRILGMTLTRFCTDRQTLEELKPRFLLVEEAGELLEGQLAAAMIPSLEHVVLIGDHYQLQGLPASIEIATQTKLGISTFERLYRDQNFTSTIKLNVQHRMHEHIAEVVKFFYHDKLETAPECNKRRLEQKPDFLKDAGVTVGSDTGIRGMRHRLAWINDIEGEEIRTNTGSVYNIKEARKVAQLVRFLVVELGVKAESVAILSLYRAQCGAINLALRGIPALARCIVSTADAFQGLESDVVVLSLVRTGKELGFCAKRNRVCVAVSRARQAFYIVGKEGSFKEDGVWNRVHQRLRLHGRVSRQFYTTCIRCHEEELQEQETVIGTVAGVAKSLPVEELTNKRFHLIAGRCQRQVFRRGCGWACDLCPLGTVSCNFTGCHFEEEHNIHTCPACKSTPEQRDAAAAA